MQAALETAADNLFRGGSGWPVDFHQALWSAVYEAVGFGPMELPGEDVDGRSLEYPVTHWEKHPACEKRHVLAMLDRIINDDETPPITGADAFCPTVLFNIIMQAGNLLSFGRNGFEGGAEHDGPGHCKHSVLEALSVAAKEVGNGEEVVGKLIESAARQIGLFIPACGDLANKGAAHLIEWNKGLPAYDSEAEDAPDPAMEVLDKAAKALPVHSDMFSRFPAVRDNHVAAVRLSMPDGGAEGEPCDLEDAATKHAAVMTSPAIIRLVSHALEHLNYIMGQEEADNFYPGCELGLAAIKELERRGAGKLAKRPLYQQAVASVASDEPIDNINAVHSIADGGKRTVRLSMPSPEAIAKKEANDPVLIALMRTRALMVSHWIKGKWCADKFGVACNTDDRQAEQFCLQAGLEWVIYQLYPGLHADKSLIGPVVAAVRTAVGLADNTPLSEWENKAERTHGDIIVALNKALDALSPGIEYDESGLRKFRPDGVENTRAADANCILCGDDIWDGTTGSDKGAECLPPPGYGVLCGLCKDFRGQFPSAPPSEPAAPRLSMPEGADAAALDAKKPGAGKGYEPVDQDAINGTCKQGELKMSEADLIRVFGEPNMEPSMDGKVNIGWIFRTIAGDVFTIYDWKGCRWSIGGDFPVAVQAVSDALEAAGVEKRYESPDNMNVGGRIVVPGGGVRFSMPDAAASPLAVYKPTTMVDGTCRQGSLRGMDEAALCRIFGAARGRFRSREWAFTNEVGDVFTIYEHKGDRWGIGGRDKGAVAMVEGILKASGVDCKRRVMMLYGKPYEPVLYVGDLPELPCEAYSWGAEQVEPAPVLALLQAARARILEGWNKVANGWALDSNGHECHSGDKEAQSWCLQAALLLADGEECCGNAEQQERRHWAMWEAVQMGAGLPCQSGSAGIDAVVAWENADDRTHMNVLAALDGAIRHVAAGGCHKCGGDIERPIWEWVDKNARNASGGSVYRVLCRSCGAVEQAAGRVILTRCPTAFSMPEVEMSAAAEASAPAMPALDLKKAVRGVDAAIRPLKWSMRRPLSGECLIERAERLVRELENEPAEALGATIRQNIRNALDDYRRAREADAAACPRFSMPENVAPRRPFVRALVSVGTTLAELFSNRCGSSCACHFYPFPVGLGDLWHFAG